MSDDGNGNGDFVTVREFRGYVDTTHEALDRINVALWGESGRNGIVGDIRDIKTKGKIWDRATNFIIGILGAIITAILLRGI